METSPTKIVTYPIADDPNAGAVFLFGELDAPNLAICCAGYPDDHENLIPFACHLAKQAHCLVGVTCLPGYDDREDHPYTANKPQGYTFDEMICAMREAVKVLRKESTYTKGTATLTGIFHDWGVMPGVCYTNRALIEAEAAAAGSSSDSNNDNDLYCPDKVVLFDVMGPPHPETENMPIVRTDTFYETFITLTYRIVFATAFSIRRFVSKTLAQVYLIPNMVALNVLRLGPTLEIDAKVLQQRRVPISLDRMIYMAYPYYYMFKAMLSGTMATNTEFCLPRNLVKTPFLYMYGVEKRINFHDRRSVEVLKREAKAGRKSNAIAVEGAGHWLYLQQAELCLKEVVKFVLDA